MISRANQKVSIYITAFKIENDSRKTIKETMNRTAHNHNEQDKKFLCSMCLNSNGHNNSDCRNKFARPCPICCKKHTCDHKNERKNDRTDLKSRDTTRNGCKEKINEEKHHLHTKDVQTSQTDLTQDLSLLKEVLTVFQSKKQLDIKSNSRTVVMKDVSVETVSKSKTELQAKLTKSRIFQYSIEDDNKNSGNNFKIVNYSQPYNVNTSQYSIDLLKHKSSSIPQMKLEELKYSLKEKTKSKDAIEEVNRMFATVRRIDSSNPEEQNRPMIRNGPRVLPVVKTKTYNDSNKKSSDGELESVVRKLPAAYHENKGEIETPRCKCCQSKGIQLSGGDSFFKHECCYHKMLSEGRCEKCVCMLCCHYQKHNTDTGALACDCLKRNSNEILKERCDGCNHF